MGVVESKEENAMEVEVKEVEILEVVVEEQEEVEVEVVAEMYKNFYQEDQHQEVMVHHVQ